MTRAHPCDACGRQRRSWERLCGVCWTALPADIRREVVDTWRAGRRSEWRAARRRAIDHMAAMAARHMERHRLRTAALTGERDA